MTTWDDLRMILARLRVQQPSPLLGFPDPSAKDQDPPFAISLAAWAEDIARELDVRFEKDVVLRVGVFG